MKIKQGRNASPYFFIMKTTQELLDYLNTLWGSLIHKKIPYEVFNAYQFQMDFTNLDEEKYPVILANCVGTVDGKKYGLLTHISLLCSVVEFLTGARIAAVCDKEGFITGFTTYTNNVQHPYDEKLLETLKNMETKDE